MSWSACPHCGTESATARCAGCGTALRVGAYTVLRVLAQGAHGRVYLAEDREGARIALKELVFARVASAQNLEAFEREARILQSIDDPLIPRFTASFQDGEGVATRLYLAQEFVEGENLEQRLASHRYTAEEVRDVALTVLSTLSILHGRTPKILHRDIKPANLILRPDGQVCLVDFGSVRESESATTFRSTLVGTFGYMPFEQAGGTADETSDLYALGATLSHLLSRRPPHELLRDGIRLELPSTLNVPPSLRRFLERLVEPDRAKRFASANQALIALHRSESGPPKKWTIVAAAALIIGIATATAIRGHPPPVLAQPQQVPAQLEPAPPAASQLGTLRSRLRFGAGADGSTFAPGLKPLVEAWIASSTPMLVDSVHPERIAGIGGLLVVPGVFDRAVTIAGLNEYRPGVLSEALTQGTLAVWLRLETSQDFSGTARLVSSLQGGVQLNLTDGRFQLFKGDEFVEAPAPDPGEFHHLAIAWGQRLDLFLDGVPIAGRLVSRVASAVQGLALGGVHPGSRVAPFSVSDLRVYSGVLTTSDVRSLAEEGKGLTKPTSRCLQKPAPVSGELVSTQNFSAGLAGGSGPLGSGGLAEVVTSNDGCALILRWRYREVVDRNTPKVETTSITSVERMLKASEEMADCWFDFPLRIEVPERARLWLVYDVRVADSAEIREWWRQPAGVMATGERIGDNLQQVTITHGIRPGRGGGKIVFAQLPSAAWVRDRAVDLTDLFERTEQGRLQRLTSLRLEGDGRDFEAAFANVRLVLERR
jgi:serine/threonine-protein kinase